MKCRLCDRALTNSISIAKGVGPECELKRGQLLCAAGSSAAEFDALAALDKPAVTRWLELSLSALRYHRRCDAERFLAQARGEARTVTHTVTLIDAA